jgi:hypothetical protein
MGISVNEISITALNWPSVQKLRKGCMSYELGRSGDERLRDYLESRVGRHLRDRRKRESFAMYAFGISSSGGEPSGLRRPQRRARPRPLSRVAPTRWAVSEAAEIGAPIPTMDGTPTSPSFSAATRSSTPNVCGVPPLATTTPSPHTQSVAA